MHKKEMWKNVTKGTVVVSKFDNNENIVRSDVKSGQTITVTEEERHLNDQLAYDLSVCVFRSGVLEPVRLVDSAEDIEDIKSNPNLKSEAELVELIKGHGNKLKSHLSTINNVITLHRIYDLAIEHDVSMSKINAIKAAITEVDPSFIFNDD